MLGLLGTKKFSNDDLIKELLNPTLNLENLNKIKEKSKFCFLAFFDSFYFLSL
jgi:hypothetical protein